MVNDNGQPAPQHSGIDPLSVVLTEEQETAIHAVMAKLARFDTPRLIDASTRLRLPDRPDENTKRRFRAAYAGAIAAQKIQYYLPALRSANARRLELGRQIGENNRKACELALSDPLASIEPELEADALAGEQETALHIYAVCIRVILKLLPAASRAAGYKFPKADLDSLKRFEPLRHFYEHLWEQLPGQGGDYVTEVCIETEDESGWRIIWGLPTNETGAILLGGQTINVSSESVAAVQDVVERAWRKLRESALEHAEKFLRANPERTPHPERIPTSFASMPGGALASQRPFRPYDLEGSGWREAGGLWLPPEAHFE